MKKRFLIISMLFILCIFNYKVYSEEIDIKEKQVLNLGVEEAVKLAQKNSTELVDIEIKISESKKSLRKYFILQEEYDKLLNMSFEELDKAGIYNITENYAEKMLHQYMYYVNHEQYTINSLENQKKQLLIKIKIDTKVQYYKIALLEKTIELNLLELEKSINSKNIMKISYENSYVNKLEMVNAEMDVLLSQQKLDNNKNMLKIEKIKLLQSIGIDSNAEFLIKDGNLSYLPLDNIILEDCRTHALENRPEIIAKKDQVKSVDLYKQIMSAYYGRYSEIGEIETKRYNNVVIELENLKNDLNTYVTSKYLVLIQKELKIKNSIMQGEIINKENRKTEILYDNGQISNNEFLDFKIKLLSSQIDNYKLLVEFFINKEIFENVSIISYEL